MDNSNQNQPDTNPTDNHQAVTNNQPPEVPVNGLADIDSANPVSPEASKTVRSLLTTILLFACAIGVAFLLTSFVFQQYEVDGPSMQTTLHNQDRLIVVKISRTWASITGHSYIPARGSIIIFSESGLYNSSGVAEKQLVKRVIGLPGERIVIKNGTVTIYNSQNPNGFDPDSTLPYGKVITTTSGNIDEVIPAGHVFVMGDNRPDSLDSRYFGPVATKNIIGKVDLRVYPFNTTKVL